MFVQYTFDGDYPNAGFPETGKNGGQMKAQPLRIAMRDTSDGYPISPNRVPLVTLRAFAKDVDELVRGDSGEISPRALEVSVIEGSLAIETVPISNAQLWHDLLRLSASQVVDSINARRRAVIERWQKAARSTRQVAFEITSAVLPAPIVVNRDSDYHSDDADQWVSVERYLQGEVFELGGLTNINAHIRLLDGKTIVVSARREVLQGDKTNRLFKLAMVRIAAEYNVVTRDYRDARLIEFAQYDRTPDEQALSRLVERGKRAWSDVPDASDWVDSLRGDAQ